MEGGLCGHLFCCMLLSGGRMQLCWMRKVPAHGELQETLLTNASGVILAHNHPSGNLKPSEPDKIMTERIRKALTVTISVLLMKG